jgi:hypothetical protein
MSKCVTLKCNQNEMSNEERETQYLSGWVGITMYDHICLKCFNQLKEEII